MPVANTVSARTLMDVLFEDGTAGRCLVAPDGTVLRVNAEWLRSTGLTEEKAVGADIAALFPATRDASAAAYTRARAGQRVEVPPHAEVVSGRQTWWEGSIEPVAMEGGTGLLVTTREVAAPQDVLQPGEDTEETLTAELMRCQRVIEGIADEVWVCDAKGRMSLMNLPDITAMGLEEFEAKTIEQVYERVDILYPDGRPRPPEEAPLLRSMRSGEVVRGEEIMRHRATGRVRHRQFSAAPMREKGRITGAVAIVRDITARKMAEKERSESEERFHALVVATSDAVYRMSSDWSEMLQLSSQGFLARTDAPIANWTQKYIPPDDQPLVTAAAQNAVHTGSTFELEHRVLRVDGSVGWTFSRAVPLRDASEAIVEWLGVASDVTERKRAEDALRESEEHLRMAQQAARIGSFEFYPQTNVSLWSPELEALYGLSPGGYKSTYAQWASLVHPDDLPDAERCLRESLDTGVFETEWRIVRADGTIRWVAGRGQVLKDADGKPVRMLGVNLDITDRKRAEEALRESEGNYRARLAELQAVLDTVPAAVWIARDARGDRIDANRFGAELLHRPGGSNVSVTAPTDDRPTNFRVMRNGRELSGDELPIQATARFGRAIRGFEEDLVFDDGRVLHLLGNTEPLLDEQGTPRGSVGAFIDITDRKRAEEALREVNQRLVEADRRKDEFLGMLSHELRNPLAPIRNALYVLDHAEPNGQQARRAKDIASRQVAHMTRLVDDLLDVTRIVRGKIDLRRQELDVVALASRTVEDYRALMRDRGIELDVALPSGPVLVNGDEARLTQALGNLLHNAAKFTPSGGHVTVAVGHQAGHAVIHVRDNGMGIDAETLQTIFEPFVQARQTLARTEGGLGLGLALVKGLVELHGGEVTASSAGRELGTEFTVKIPLDRRQAVRPRAAIPAQQQETVARRVLVVDDNRDAAESLSDLLQMAGHEVAVAHDGPSALAQAQADPPDVVLCDIGLPGMDGYEVARHLRATGPRNLRLVAVSGYAQPEDVARATDAGFDAHIAKPPDPEKIRRLLS